MENPAPKWGRRNSILHTLVVVNSNKDAFSSPVRLNSYPVSGSQGISDAFFFVFFLFFFSTRTSDATDALSFSIYAAVCRPVLFRLASFKRNGDRGQSQCEIIVRMSKQLTICSGYLLTACSVNYLLRLRKICPTTKHNEDAPLKFTKSYVTWVKIWKKINK